MACRICRNHGDDALRLPPAKAQCPVCGEPTAYEALLVPHIDWEYRVSKLLEALEVPRPFPELDPTKIVLWEEHGLWWAKEAELRNAGFPPGWMVDGALFELNGKVYELMGRSIKQRVWWVEYIAPSPFAKEEDETKAEEAA